MVDRVQNQLLSITELISKAIVIYLQALLKLITSLSVKA